MSLLLHALAPRPLADPPAGLGGAPLEFIDLGGIGAWASPAPDAVARDDVFEHHRVVEQLCARQPCLPVRSGMRVEDAARARELLASRLDQLAASLERVGDRRELAVTLLWTEAPARPGRGHDVAPAQSGRSFLERKRADHAASDERRRAAERLAESLEAGLAADRADIRHAYCPSPAIALSTAVLAPAGGEHAFKERAVRVAGALAGVRVVVSGPWPPYTFAAAT